MLRDILLLLHNLARPEDCYKNCDRTSIIDDPENEEYAILEAYLSRRRRLQRK